MVRNSFSAVRCWNSRPHDKTPAVGETWLFGESVMSSYLIDFTVYYRWTFINVSIYNLGQNQGWENGAFWFLRGFILDLGRGGGGADLLFHFVLSKIVVWRRLVDATGDSKSFLPEAYLLILEKIASIHCFDHSSKLSVVNTFSSFCSSFVHAISSVLLIYIPQKSEACRTPTDKSYSIFLYQHYTVDLV